MPEDGRSCTGAEGTIKRDNALIARTNIQSGESEMFLGVAKGKGCLNILTAGRRIIQGKDHPRGGGNKIAKESHEEDQVITGGNKRNG